MTHERAGLPALATDLIDVDALCAAYYDLVPDVAVAGQEVSFGTSGHRGTSTNGSFNDAHIAATTQAICELRRAHGVDGPLLIGKDPHALSEPARQTALEVLVANDVEVWIDSGRFTPTPSLSRAVIALNATHSWSCDAIVVTPSHNPPSDGGFKYNPPHGGPADSTLTAAIAERANELLANGLRGVRRVSPERAKAACTSYDFMGAYVDDLAAVVDLDAIRSSGVTIGADPMGGAAVDYYGAIAERYGLALTVVNDAVDPRWPSMTLDWDGQIRMDCSSPYAMASLIAQREHFDVGVGNDADADRHGVVTPDAGLLNPNHFLTVAIDYLLQHRPGWSQGAGIGKTMVSSSLIDRVVAGHGRALWEVPVGFKWFVPGLHDGSLAFGGEESAGASYLRQDGSVWSTDKDGISLALLAAEIQAVTGQSASQRYRLLTDTYGDPAYARVDAPATREEKITLGALTEREVTTSELAGEPVVSVQTHAPGNDAALGGVKVATAHAWFAARPSGTEDVYKIYAESFLGAEHLSRVQGEARELVSRALRRS